MQKKRLFTGLDFHSTPGCVTHLYGIISCSAAIIYQVQECDATMFNRINIARSKKEFFMIFIRFTDFNTSQKFTCCIK